MAQVFVGGLLGRSGGRTSRGAAFLSPAGALVSTVSPDLRPASAAVLADVDFVLPEVGGAVVAGGFDFPQRRLARVLADGSNDATFTPDIANGNVDRVLAHGTGYLILGSFTTVGGQSRNGFARLNPDGSVDMDWDHALPSAATAVAIHGSGVLVAYGTSSYGLLRLGSDGAEDTGFTTHTFNQRVRAIHVQPSGKIICGGDFTEVDGSMAVLRIVRFAADGGTDGDWVGPTTDTEWSTWAVYAIHAASTSDLYCELRSAAICRVKKLDEDGTTIAWGTGASTDLRGPITIDPDDGVAAWAYQTSGQPELRRFYSDGTAIPGWGSTTTTGNTTIGNIIVLPDDSVLACGSMATFNGHAVTGVVHVLPDASLDTSFTPGFAGPVRAIAQMADGSIAAVGKFSTVGAAITPYMARARDGVADPDYRLTLGLSVAGTPAINVIRQDEALGRTYIGGFFSSVTPAVGNSHQFRSVARLMPDGSPDPDFDDPGLMSSSSPASVYDILVEEDSSIVVVGSISSAKGDVYARNRIARFNADGSIVAAFNPPVVGAGFVRRVLKQPDGKYLVAGSFTTFDSVSMAGVLRLNADGTRDTSWSNPAVNVTSSTRQVFDMALQPDGKVLIVGDFTTVGGSSAAGVARLNADGTRDTGFTPGVTGQVNCVELAPDGSMFVGGGAAVGKMNGDGTVATWTNPFTSPDVVNELYLCEDGTLLAAGVFQRSGQVSLARLLPTGAIDAAFSIPCLADDGTMATLASVIECADAPLEARMFDDNFLPFESRQGAYQYRAYGGDPPYTFSVRGRAPDGLGLVAPAPNVRSLSGTFAAGGRFIWEVVVTDAAGASALLTNDVRIAPLVSPIGALVMRDAGGSVFRLTRYDSTGTSVADLHAFNNTAHIKRVRDKSIVARGSFTTVDSVTRRYLTKHGPDGTLDPGFPGLANGTVAWVAGNALFPAFALHSDVDVQSDGRLILACTLFNSPSAGNRTGQIRRINLDGSNDSGFVLDSDISLSFACCVFVEADDSILVGGRAAASGNNAIIFRIDPDGVLDDAFLAAFPGSYTSAQRFNTSAASLWTTVSGDWVGQNWLTQDATTGGSTAPNCVFDIALSASGDIVVGGGLGRRGTATVNRVRGVDWINPSGGFAGSPRDTLINGDATILDTTLFDSPVVNRVYPLGDEHYLLVGTYTHQSTLTWRLAAGAMTVERTEGGIPVRALNTDTTDGTAYGITVSDRMADGRLYVVTTNSSAFPVRTAKRLFPDGSVDTSFASINNAYSIVADDNGISGFNADGFLGVELEAAAGEETVPFSADGSLYLLGGAPAADVPVETVHDGVTLSPTHDALPIYVLRNALAAVEFRSGAIEALLQLTDALAMDSRASLVLFEVVTDLALFDSPAQYDHLALARAVDRVLAEGVASGYVEAISVALDAMVLRSLADGFDFAQASDSVLLSKAVADAYTALGQVIDRLLTQPEATGYQHLTAIVLDSVVLDGTPSTEAEFYQMVRDAVGLSMHLTLDSGDYVAWVLNTEGKGVSTYANYPFNSFMELGGKWYGVTGEGLFLLEGEDDAGEPISARIRLGLTDMNTRKLKRLPEAYIGYKSDGNLILRTIVADDATGEKVALEYLMRPRPAVAMRESRFEPGRGVKAVDWDFEIENINGADFDLAEVEFHPLIMDRRTRG